MEKHEATKVRGRSKPLTRRGRTRERFVWCLEEPKGEGGQGPVSRKPVFASKDVAYWRIASDTALFLGGA